MSITNANKHLQDYDSGLIKPTFFVLKAFEAMKAVHWTRKDVLTKCEKHDMDFHEGEEPCWHCYKEFDDRINETYNRQKGARHG